MGFWDFVLMTTLIVVFFPWSLLFCLIVYGWDDTKLRFAALIQDAIKTVLAVLFGLACIICLVITMIMSTQ